MDISYDPDGSGNRHDPPSKADQTGEGRELYLSPPAVAQLRRCIETAGLTEGAAFRAIDQAGRPGDRLQAAEVARIIKRLAWKAGLPGRPSHACLAIGHGARRWKSMQMPARYSERLEAKRGVVAQLQHKLNSARG